MLHETKSNIGYKAPSNKTIDSIKKYLQSKNYFLLERMLGLSLSRQLCETEYISGKLFQPVVSMPIWDQPPVQKKNKTAFQLLPGLSSPCPPAAHFDDIIHDLISC